MYSKPEPTPRVAFVFYETFLEAIKLAPRKEQNKVLRHLVECGLGQRRVETLPYPSRSIVRPMLTSIENANHRYYAAIRRGETGGRPKVEVDLDLAQHLYVECGSWKEVAKRMDLSEATLYRARRIAGQI